MVPIIHNILGNMAFGDFEAISENRRLYMEYSKKFEDSFKSILCKQLSELLIRDAVK